jgi:hypothetical protein
VNFTTNLGGIGPFSQTTDGLATSDYTAPITIVDAVAAVTATVGGVAGATVVNITGVPITTTPLLIVPGSAGVNGALGGATGFTISGGTPPYVITSTDPLSVFDTGPGDGTWNGPTDPTAIIATVPAGTCSSTVTLNVFDSVGGTTSATINITTSPLTITPTSATICENDATCGAGVDNANFTVAGGVLPYTVTSSNIAVIPNPVGNPFNVNATNASIAADTTVTLTVLDACTATTSASVLVIDQ